MSPFEMPVCQPDWLEYAENGLARKRREVTAVWFQYSANRKGEHPTRHLKGFTGILQADAFAGFHPIYESGDVLEAACWGHARRKLWDIHERQHRMPDTLAHEGLVRIGRLFAIEAQIRGRPPEERLREAAIAHQATFGRAARMV